MLIASKIFHKEIPIATIEDNTSNTPTNTFMIFYLNIIKKYTYHNFLREYIICNYTY